MRLLLFRCRTIPFPTLSKPQRSGNAKHKFGRSVGCSLEAKPHFCRTGWIFKKVRSVCVP